MKRYKVNASLVVPAYISVEAESEPAALEEASALPASYWETDMGSATVDFNVYPVAEEEA